MLTKLQRKGLNVVHYGFIYMCPHPVEWDLKTGEIVAKPTPKRMFFLALNLSLVGSISLACMYVIGTHFFVCRRENVDSTIVALLVCGWAPVSFAWLAAVYMFANRGYYKLAQPTFKLVAALFKKYPPQDNGNTLLDKMMLPGTLTAVLTPWAVLFTCIPFNFDPFYFVLEDIWGSSPRTGLQIYGGLLFRAFTLLGGFETARILGILGTSLLIFLYKFRKTMEVSLSGVPSYVDVMKGYGRALILYGVWSPLLNQTWSTVLTCWFWFLVIGLHVALMEYGKAPFPVYFIISTFSVVLTSGLLLGISLMANVGEGVNSVIDRCRKATKFTHARARRTIHERNCKVKMLEAKAMRKICFQYYPFLDIDASFTLNTMGNMMNRLVDSMLIF